MWWIFQSLSALKHREALDMYFSFCCTGIKKVVSKLRSLPGMHDVVFHKKKKKIQTRKSTKLIIFIWLKWWHLTEGANIACKGWDWTASSGPYTYTHTIPSPSYTLSSKKQSLSWGVCPSSSVSLVLCMQFPVRMDPCLWELWHSTAECCFGSSKLMEQSPISAGVPFIPVLPHSLCSEAFKFFKSFFKLGAFQYYLTIKEPQFKPSCFLFQLRLQLLCSPEMSSKTHVIRIDFSLLPWVL